MIPTNNPPRIFARGWKQRSEIAKAKTAAARDPARLLAVRIRTMQADLSLASVYAAEEFAAAHAPVASAIPQLVHRDVAALLGRFLHEHGLVGADLTQPRELHETVEEIAARHRDRIQADLDQGARELAELERARAVERIQAAEIGLEHVDRKHTAFGIAVETVTDDQPVKRGRGKAPKMVADPSADVVPD